MPRIRTIKPEALQHRKVGRLSDRAFRVWVGAITRADDEGRLLVDLGEMRLLFYGYHEGVTSADVGLALDEIVRLGLLRLYVGDGALLAEFPSWHDHQRINRPSPSKLPSSQEGKVVPNLAEADRLLHADSRSHHGALTEPSRNAHQGSDRSGSERRGSEKNSLSAPPTVRSQDNGFDELWALHPGPKGPKGEALKAYRQVKPPPEAVKAMRAQVVYKGASDRRGIFCAQLPHLHRWIRKRRWEDELPPLPCAEAEPEPLKSGGHFPAKIIGQPNRFRMDGHEIDTASGTCSCGAAEWPCSHLRACWPGGEPPSGIPYAGPEAAPPEGGAS